MCNSQKSLKEIIISKIIGDYQTLYEASLARIWQHVSGSEKTGLALLTSWRQSLTRSENIKRLTRLKSNLRTLGLGFFVVNGHWRECQDPTVSYDDCPPDQLIDAIEPALFIPGIDLKTATSLSKEYDQDAILYSGPETEGKATLYFRDGSTMSLGVFSPGVISQAYTELISSKKNKNKKTFAFEGLSWIIQGRTESLVEQQIKSTFLSTSIEMG